MIRLIIAGTRDADKEVIESCVMAGLRNLDLSLSQVDEIISGGSGNVDWFAISFAIKNEIKCRIFPAKWKVHGKAAGPYRNQEMADRGTHLIVVWDGESKGTASMIYEAKRHKLKFSIQQI